ncbi:Pectinesterase inhibitor domain - like 10 [Theobroma cacao]|nr:Pectinesterase inhibitor domain - like 10 [Theobroma cacao]WRX15288.1 Pectinesterase inhibitor domain - like 10 [Theobroma cacao]
MANKQQISFSLAFLAVALFVLAGQATARREILNAEVGGAANPKDAVEMILNELISSTQRAKNKVSVLGNSQMVQACDKAYASSLESLNKAMGLVKGTAGIDTGNLKASITAALHGYDNCDYAFAESTRPSPFIPNNANLKSLVSQCLELTSKLANNN